MPSKKSELRKHAEVRPSSLPGVEPLKDIRALLKDRRLAIEQVFLATHGRAMTEAERRRLLDGNLKSQ